MNPDSNPGLDARVNGAIMSLKILLVVLTIQDMHL